MAKNFLDQEEDRPGLSFSDGFRFGLGFFIANLLGLVIIAAAVAVIEILTGHQLH